MTMSFREITLKEIGNIKSVLPAVAWNSDNWTFYALEAYQLGRSL